MAPGLSACERVGVRGHAAGTGAGRRGGLVRGRCHATCPSAARQSRRSLGLAALSLILVSRDGRSEASPVEAESPPSSASGQQTFEPEVRNQDIAVFAAGVLPFVWATGEFWRRVLRGEVFGTGRDKVVIPKPSSFAAEEADLDEGEAGEGKSAKRRAPGRQLTSAALNAAYALFVIAGGSLALALVAFLQAKPE